MRELMDTIFHLVQSQGKFGLFTMNFNLLDHQCKALEKFWSVKLLTAAPFVHFDCVLKRAYRRTSMKRATRLQETPSALKSFVDGLKMKGRDGFITVYSPVKAKWMKTLEKGIVCFQEMGCKIKLDKLLKMNINGFSHDAEPETAVAETLNKHLS